MVKNDGGLAREQYRSFLMSVIDRLHGQMMRQTVENSEWHREENVFVHTEMVTDKFMQFGAGLPFNEFRLGLIACAYHDVGKPWVKEPHPDGGFSFYNHEVNSANRLRNDFWRDAEVRALFCEDQAELNFVRFIVQVHLPYKFHTQMLSKLKASIIYYGRQANLTEEQSLRIYKNFILSDAHGRISDDHETKMNDVEEWFRSFESVSNYVYTEYPTDQFPILTMIYGAMGGGKTTLCKEMSQNYEDMGYETIYIGVDDIREKILTEAYNKPFDELTHEEYHSMASEVNGSLSKTLTKIKRSYIEGTPLVIFVDATFVTRKRRIFVKELLRIGTIDLLEIDKPVSFFIENNEKRTGRAKVNPSAIYSSYFSTCLPFVDEMFHG